MTAQPKKLFITGSLRSGTTLVDKLLANSPHGVVFSQPTFPAFLKAKSEFLKCLGLPERRYPLGHLFGETNFSPSDFLHFMESYKMLTSDFVALLQPWDGTSGVDASVMTSLRRVQSSLSFSELIERLLGVWSQNTAKPPAYTGLKEVICEEFIPYLLECGWKVIGVIRDPRAVIASMFLGSSGAFVNRRITILYAVRQWRKSVAFALRFRSHPNYFRLMYEDLVTKPHESINSLQEHLSLPVHSFEDLPQPLLDQSGHPWRGNSSFAQLNEVSESSRAKYKTLLPVSLQNYIETVCAPEMKLLGYEVSDTESFCHEDSVSSEGAEYGLDRADELSCVLEERSRRQMLLNPGQYSHDEVTSKFVFSETFHVLSSGWLY